MLNSLLQVWRTADDVETRPAGDRAGSNAPPSPGMGGIWGSSSTPLARTLRPWFVVLLVIQVCLIIIRWHMGDAHGALLMFVVFSVGIIAAAVDPSGIDVVYGGYFGLMAFVSGLLDLNMAIEKLVWSEWHHKALSKGDLS